MKDLISIIIPVYKVEQYLDKCVQSIVDQTYENIEILLIDDGSPDKCPEICDKWAQKDKRVKVIHKANGGLSSARNKGIELSKGEYIAFIDSDDSLDPYFVEELYNSLQDNDCDLAVSNVKCVNEDGEELPFKETFIHKKLTNEDKFDFLFERNTMTSIIACDKLYARYIFDTLRFPEGKIHEDEFVIYDVINNVKKGISFVDKPMYIYLKRKGSITSKQKPSYKSFDGIEAMKDRLAKVGDNSKYTQMAAVQLFNTYVSVYTKVYSNKQMKRDLRALYKEDFKKLKLHPPTFKLKVKFFLFRWFPFLVMLITKYKMNKRNKT